MKLVPMTQAEYDVWRSGNQRRYIEAKVIANKLTESQAEKHASTSFARMLPEGINTKDNFLLSVKDENETLVGFTWYLIAADDPLRGYVCDVIVGDQYRGRGYGRKIMHLLEAEMKKRGVTRVGLMVFEFNTVAIKLYESLGFETTIREMNKELSD